MSFEKLEGENSGEDQEGLPESGYHGSPKTEPAIGARPETKETKVDFSSAEDWEELFRQIGEKGYIRGSRELFSPEELKRRISGVREGIYGLDSITNTGGLRDTVGRLLEQDEKRETIGN